MKKTKSAVEEGRKAEEVGSFINLLKKILGDRADPGAGGATGQHLKAVNLEPWRPMRGSREAKPSPESRRPPAKGGQLR